MWLSLIPALESPGFFVLFLFIKLVFNMASKQLIASLLAAYLAMVLTACGGSGSVLTINVAPPPVEKPAFSIQPDKQSVVTGSSATFTVTATGSAPLAYQWKKNGINITGGTGATTNTYTTPATSLEDNAAVFTVVVSNSAGAATSSEAQLTVTASAEPAAIATQPADQSVTEGQTATFSLAATGTAPLRYQWRKNGTDIPGATFSTYTTPATSITDIGNQYSVVVDNNFNKVTSNRATLTVTVAPTINTQPANQSVTTGQTATFSVAATGTAPLRYQWKKNGTDIPGATSSTYTTPAISSADNAAVFTVVVSNSAGFSVTSSNATLTVPGAVVVPVVEVPVGVTPVLVAPAISTQPAAQTVRAGQSATFGVTATGTAPLGYQWTKNGTYIIGATSSTYTTPATSYRDNGAVFSVLVSNGAGIVTSSIAALTVNSFITISAQPAAQNITAGQTATFSVTATGTGTLSYQWKKNGVNITGGTGATTNTYTTPAMGYAGNGAVYSVAITDSINTVTSSSPATLTVNKTTTPQSYGYVANASDGFYDKTECVQDNNTGLIWEGKPTTDTRAATLTYTNYDDVGSAQTYNGSTYVNPTQTDIDATTNSIGYKNSVNTSALCGYTDWRLPTKDELLGIVASSGSPKIDTTWFLNTQPSPYWSSSPSVSNSYKASNVYFYSGNVGNSNRGNYGLVRLVRASQ